MKAVITFLCILLLIPLMGYSQTEHKPKYAPRKETHKNRTDELNRKQGLWKHYNYLGTLIWEIEYTDDMRNGISKRYYYNGRLMRETEYSYDKKDGLFKRFDYDGNVRTEGEYVNGKKENRWINYNRNSQIRNEGLYSNGYKNGEWKYYNRKGEIINTIVFKNGRDVRDILAAEKRAAEAKKAADAKAKKNFGNKTTRSALTPPAAVVNDTIKRK